MFYHIRGAAGAPFGSGFDDSVETQTLSKIRVGFELASDFQNDPGNPICLELPMYGTVRVYAVDPVGKPVSNLDSVTLTGAWPQFEAQRSFVTKDVQGHYATIPFVEVGLEVEVACSLAGVPRPQRITGEGPTQHL